ncbi:hypothetical protein QYE76_026618 [Lolium multiflorum]|uniref:CCHC-type domain-containing protein n=1 Tax=Lolium multiflorum TaxID=4521 RepID=A0AAD8RI47_LOLMU|nr:hypothetical protein QYE76_026618 [Lolium multiflorum]
MAKGSTVPPTMEPNMPRGDKDEDEYEEEDWVVSLRDKGESVFKVLYKDKIASSHFFEILTTAIESQKLIWMHENTIDKKGALEREYADDVASLKNDLEEEQETVASLEEQLQTLEVSQNEIFAKLTKERDHAKAKFKLLKNEKFKVGVGHDKLVKDLDDLDKAHKALESEHSILTKSYEQLQASYLKEHAMLPSLLDMSCDDACATNSTSCEASILKENVDLRAQLDLLTCNYGKLEENHGKLSSSHEDLLASHDRLKLAHEAIISKATPCSTSSSTCVVTNHVEEIKELKAQVTSLKNDLVKSHEGKCKLDTMLSVKQSPNDKSGLGFKSNNKNKSKNNNNKKGQVQVKDPAKIVCFKCKIEGHHVRSCPLKKKQKGKRPQAQTHIQPQVEEIPLPKKNQANAPIVEKSSEKKEKKRTCYICRTSTKKRAMKTKPMERENEEDGATTPPSALQDRNFRPDASQMLSRCFPPETGPAGTSAPKDRNFRPPELPPKFRSSKSAKTIRMLLRDNGAFGTRPELGRNFRPELPPVGPELPPLAGTSAHDDRNFRPIELQHDNTFSCNLSLRPTYYIYPSWLRSEIRLDVKLNLSLAHPCGNPT